MEIAYREFLILQTFGEQVLPVFVGEHGEDELLDEEVLLAQAHQNRQARAQVGSLFRVDESVGIEENRFFLI